MGTVRNPFLTGFPLCQWIFDGTHRGTVVDEHASTPTAQVRVVARASTCPTRTFTKLFLSRFLCRPKAFLRAGDDAMSQSFIGKALQVGPFSAFPPLCFRAGLWRPTSWWAWAACLRGSTVPLFPPHHVHTMPLQHRHSSMFYLKKTTSRQLWYTGGLAPSAPIEFPAREMKCGCYPFH